MSEYCRTINKQMNTQRDIQEIAKHLLMYCYERVNWTNCYGFTPMKSNSLPYLKAKRKALKLSKTAKDTEVYEYIKINL